MPASRSRTENWRRSLQNLRDRNGALEITLPRNFDRANTDDAPADLIWRVRILDLSPTEITVEEPMVLGQVIPIEDGREIVAIIAVGQNRWMFRTRILGRTPFRLNTHEITAMRLAMPEHVERCQRRNFYRVATVGLTLPRVDSYPLLDPASAVDAEIANRLEIEHLIDTPVAGRIGTPPENPSSPNVGPLIPTTLMNIGGGGIGLIVTPADRVAFESYRTFWLRIPLEPHIPAPISVTCRLRHTHIDSSQRLYAGLQFDFSFNPPHQKFVVDQVCRYVAQVQREQLARQNTA